MANDITNSMLLAHMQAMKNDLQQQIVGLDKKVVSLDRKMTTLTEDMRCGFEDARQHRQALQEDLEATMHMQSKHSAKLAHL